MPILLPNIVNHADVGMIERRCRLCLPLETCQRLRVSRYFIRQELECHETVEPAVLGLVDHTHTAATESLDNSIMRDCLADHCSVVPSVDSNVRDACRLSQRSDGKSAATRRVAGRNTGHPAIRVWTIIGASGLTTLDE